MDNGRGWFGGLYGIFGGGPIYSVTSAARLREQAKGVGRRHGNAQPSSAKASRPCQHRANPTMASPRCWPRRGRTRSVVRMDVRQTSTRCSFVRLIWQPGHVTGWPGGSCNGADQASWLCTRRSSRLNLPRRVSDHLHSCCCTVIRQLAAAAPPSFDASATPWLDVAARACDDLASHALKAEHGAHKGRRQVWHLCGYKSGV